jgi:flagellar biosynthesis/type III secretory pathway M-ring protein FliF/YscJ
METPIHAASEVDKGETVPKIIAGIAGLVIIAVTVAVLAYSGFWSPPATTQTAGQTQTTQTN